MSEEEDRPRVLGRPGHVGAGPDPLQDYGYDVVAATPTWARRATPKALAERAKAAGAIAVEIVDAKEEFAKDFCFPALQANALYEGVYPALRRALAAR